MHLHADANTLSSLADFGNKKHDRLGPAFRVVSEIEPVVVTHAENQFRDSPEVRWVMVDRDRQFGMVGQNVFPTAAQSLWLRSLEVEFDERYPLPLRHRRGGRLLSSPPRFPKSGSPNLSRHRSAG